MYFCVLDCESRHYNSNNVENNFEAAVRLCLFFAEIVFTKICSWLCHLVSSSSQLIYLFLLVVVVGMACNDISCCDFFQHAIILLEAWFVLRDLRIICSSYFSVYQSCSFFLNCGLSRQLSLFHTSYSQNKLTLCINVNLKMHFQIVSLKIDEVLLAITRLS